MSNIPNDKQNVSPAPPNKRLQQTQAKVDEVVDIMKINVDKVLERDKNLSKLDNRADALQAGASQFEASAGKLKKKFWLKNCKILLVLGFMITILTIVLITWVVSYHDRKIMDQIKSTIHTNSTSEAQKILENIDTASTTVSPTVLEPKGSTSNVTGVIENPSSKSSLESIPNV